MGNVISSRGNKKGVEIMGLQEMIEDSRRNEGWFKNKVNCLICGRLISAYADNCPHCQVKEKERRG